MCSQDQLSQAIVQCAQTVAKELGSGFSKDVYARALELGLRRAKWEVLEKPALDVFYQGVCVGTSNPDLVVEQRVIVGVSAGDGIGSSEIDQCRNDLKAACLVNGLLLDFSSNRLEVRKVRITSEEGVEDWVTDVLLVE